MAIIQGNAKQGSTRGFYPKVINGSLRFNDDDESRLAFTPSSAGNRKTFTYSCWFKNCINTSAVSLFGCEPDSSNKNVFFLNVDFLRFWQLGGPDVRCTPLLRDPSAWYHIVLAVDTTQATDSNRIKFYVNGVQITDFSTATWPSQNYEFLINSTNLHDIGGRSLASEAGYVNGYLANVHFIDGQALSADDFGETKNGVWVAKDYAGTFGTNGFYLTFEDDTQVEAFNTVLYRGNATDGNRVTGVGFKPDLIWTKTRDSANEHFVMDSVRGTGVGFEITSTYGDITGSQFNDSFDPDGFTVNSGARVNRNGENFVAWCWKAGDSNVSNTDGTITSTVRANDTYGFSIVSYTGDGTTSHNVGHGLSTTPSMIIVKSRNVSGRWVVAHTSIPTTNRLVLDDTFASLADGDRISAYDSTTFTHNWNGANSNQYIAYCWSETTGYSKFGSYSGSASAVTESLGFKPAFVMIKRTDSDPGDSFWLMFDNTRNVSGSKYTLYANLSAIESTDTTRTITFDEVNQTFTVPASGTADRSLNITGGTYIYAAFADTREAAFWLDQSGNDNDWQPVNLDHNDTVADSPTNNFATWNPLDKASGATLSDGNLLWTDTDSWASIRATIGVSSGQWYWECTGTSGSNFRLFVGIADASVPLTANSNLGDYNGAFTYYSATGAKYSNGIGGGSGGTTYGDTFTAGDVIGVALDMDAGTLTFYKNGVSQGTAFTGLSGTYFPAITSETSGCYVNFGQQPFKYDPPA